MWGNWAVAKLVEALFNTSRLSDVGCTYKLLHRSLALRLLPQLRVGVSAVTGDRRQAIVLGLQMIGFILLYRLKTLGRTRRPPALAGSLAPDA